MIKDEYLMLRQEILHSLNSLQIMKQITYVAGVTLLTYALSQNEPLFSLLPYIVIIPCFVMSLNLIDSMVRIAGYMIVFLEGKEFNWESRLFRLHEMRSSNKEGFNKPLLPKYSLSIFHSPFVILGYFSLLLFSYKMIMLFNNISDLWSIICFWIRIIVALIICLWLIFFTKKRPKITASDYILMWEKIKKAEQ